MDCGYFETLIYRLPDEDLSGTELAALQAHIEQCADCRALYEAVTAAHEAITEPETAPVDLGERVMNAVRAEEKARKANEERIRRNAKIRQRWRFGDLGIAAACLALVVVTVNVLYGDLGQSKTADSATEAAPMMLEEAEVEEAAPAEGALAEYGDITMDAATADTGVTGSSAASMAREAADEAAPEAVESAAEVYAADGTYLGILDPDTLESLLSDSGETAEADGAPDWTLQLYGTSYELFARNNAIYWRESGSGSLTRSPVNADKLTATLK